jgi:hypothetical protein
VNANTAKDATFDIFLAGDAMLVSPWSRAGDDATLRLFSAMREADVTILNLETVIHSFEGYAQANSGGSWMRSPPEIAQELAWAGVDMVAHANNHSFDYGSEGILQTIRHVDAAGIAISGSGRDLQQARSPRYVERSGRTVAHVAMASDFISYGKASLSLPGLRGRPGLNPLSLERKASMTVPRWAVSLIKTLDGLLGRNTERYELPNFSKNGVMISTGQTFSYQRGPRVDMADARGNIDAIVEARQTSWSSRSMPTSRIVGSGHLRHKRSKRVPTSYWLTARMRYGASKSSGDVPSFSASATSRTRQTRSNSCHPKPMTGRGWTIPPAQERSGGHGLRLPDLKAVARPTRDLPPG